MNEADDVYCTVAVYLADSNTRVLVTGLVGSDAEVRADARQHVENFAFVAPVHWLTKVVARDEITDIDPPETP